MTTLVRMGLTVICIWVMVLGVVVLGVGAAQLSGDDAPKQYPIKRIYGV